VTLTMRPHSLLSRGSHEVMHGEWQVGQIEKRSSLYGPEERWIWALNGVPAAGPEGIRRAGNTATLDEAEAALKEESMTVKETRLSYTVREIRLRSLAPSRVGRHNLA
jgi:hypothetical protein